MKIKQKTIKKESISNETKIKFAIDFIEELSWLLDSKSKRQLKLSEIPNLLRNYFLIDQNVSRSTNKYISPNPNIHYLIGVLPKLFQDSKIFARNEDIADFAYEVLGINITRVAKRSKYELIGLIVCKTLNLDDIKLNDLVKGLSIIIKSSDKLSTMAEEKSSIGFSWNETIRNLSK